MLRRFLVPELDPGRPDATLPEEEGHHLHRVLRMRIDDEVVVFDGRGVQFRARVASIARDTVIVRLLESLPDTSIPHVALTLVQSVLKGDAMDDVVRDCTMVGVDSVQPVMSERTVMKPSVVARAAMRWSRIALAAAKQSGRSRLPQIHAVMPLEDWLLGTGRGSRFLLLEPGAALPDVRTVRELAQRPVPETASLLVGPEGGWAPRERDLAITAGCTPLTLGRLTLRADAVPLAATAALLAIWDV